MPFWILQPCSRVWYHVAWYLQQLCSSFSRLLRLFRDIKKFFKHKRRLNINCKWKIKFLNNFSFISFLLYFYCLHDHRCLHFPSLCPPSPGLNTPSPSLWLSPHCCLCQWVMHTHSLANLFTFFHPVPLCPLPSNSHQSVPCTHASVSVLFVSLFLHYIPHISKIIWYLSFSDWLISPNNNNLQVRPCCHKR